MQVVLVMFRGEGERRSFSIVRDVTVIGRREDCDFRIPLGEVSRKHCRLIRDGNTLRLDSLLGYVSETGGAISIPRRIAPCRRTASCGR